MVHFEDIVAAWSRTIVPAVREVSIPVSVLLSETRPVSLHGSRLWVTIEGQFHREVLSYRENRRIVEDVLRDVTGENLGLIVWALENETQGKTPVKTKSSYAQYLKSDHWQHMREIAEEHYGKPCNLCGSTTRVETHHRTYERLGRERLSDLIRLCRKCHSRFHGKER